MNGQGPGIWLYHRDESGLVSSVSIVVEECANEPPHRKWRGGDTIHTAPKLTHEIACYVMDDGATLLCRDCGRARLAIEARVGRLSRLSPEHRAWLEKQGLHDWQPR